MRVNMKPSACNTILKMQTSTFYQFKAGTQTCYCILRWAQMSRKQISSIVLLFHCKTELFGRKYGHRILCATHLDEVMSSAPISHLILSFLIIESWSRTSEFIPHCYTIDSQRVHGSTQFHNNKYLLITGQWNAHGIDSWPEYKIQHNW